MHAPMTDRRPSKSPAPHCVRTLPLLAALLAGGCDLGRKEAPPPPPPSVVASEVLVTDLPVFSEYVGQTEATATVDVRARVQGYVTKIAFAEGTQVKEGDLLFQLDKEPFQQKLLHARASLAEAKASVKKAEQDIARYKPLVEQRAIPKQDLENAQALLDRSKAAVEAAKADVRNAEIDLSYTDVHAPISGLIGDKLVDVGDLAGGSASKPLATISPLDPIWFSCNVSEVEYLSVRRELPEGKAREIPLRLILADGKEHDATGGFVFADRTVDARTGTLRVRAEFKNEGGLLRPGMFGRIRVLKDVRKDAVLVPQRAVQEVQGTYSVFSLAGDGKAAYTKIQVGARIGPLWLVTSGLKRGDKVVTDGLIRVRDGAPVTATMEPIGDEPVAELRKLIPKQG
jgi:membrane fusion protein (multidrug efflux system)